MIHEIIKNLLDSLNVDYSNNTYSGYNKQYIIYSIYNGKGDDYADNDNLSVTHYITISLWGDSVEENNIYKEIIKLFKENNFIYESEREVQDQNKFGITIDFMYNN